MSTRFHQIEINQKFTFATDFTQLVYIKVNKSQAHIQDDNVLYDVNSQAAIIPLPDISSEEANLIERIIERAQRTYGEDRIRADRLRKALYCAHRAKPIRLDDLLHTCAVDFPADVLYGAYKHYDEATDTMKNGWTAQHAEPKEWRE